MQTLIDAWAFVMRCINEYIPASTEAIRACRYI